jgi:hypothetical protein
MYFACTKVAQGNKRSSRKRGKTAIFTPSPYKAELKESQRKVANNSIAKKQLILEKPSKLNKETKTNRPKRPSYLAVY